MVRVLAIQTRALCLIPSGAGFLSLFGYPICVQGYNQSNFEVLEMNTTDETINLCTQQACLEEWCKNNYGILPLFGHFLVIPIQFYVDLSSFESMHFPLVNMGVASKTITAV